MARNTDLTQDKVNEIADELYNKGIKPSPNNVRDVLWSGSFSTIKQLLDVWKDKQKADDSIFIPDTPDFVYGAMDRLHKINEIAHLEQIIIWLEQTAVNKDADLNKAKAETEQLQTQCENINQTLTAQKIELATLSEREKQQAVQLKEKDLMLKQAEKLEQALNQQIAELTTKKHLINK